MLAYLGQKDGGMIEPSLTLVVSAGDEFLGSQT
jgi:hypothetical protein